MNEKKPKVGLEKAICETCKGHGKAENIRGEILNEDCHACNGEGTKDFKISTEAAATVLESAVKLDEWRTYLHSNVEKHKLVDIILNIMQGGEN